MKKEMIILVNYKDEEVGFEEKMKTHKKALMHRAFSIFIFNNNGEMILQKRAIEKYHCGGMWSNTCCSHPRKGEEVNNAAHRRLKEEIGFDCELIDMFTFHYKVKFNNGLTENEMDHVFLGFYDGKIKLNKKEASDFRWMKVENVEKEIKKNPDEFTVWFKIALKELKKSIKR